MGERLPYKQVVGGSSPSAPTISNRFVLQAGFFIYSDKIPLTMKSKGKRLTVSQPILLVQMNKQDCLFYELIKDNIEIESSFTSKIFEQADIEHRFADIYQVGAPGDIEFQNEISKVDAGSHSESKL